MAVEFVHPVVVGKPALPAVALTAPDPGAHVGAWLRPGDVVAVVAPAHNLAARRLLRQASRRGAMSVWIGSGAPPPPDCADHLLWTADPSPFAAATGQLVLLYHLLWELTHVCLEHPGLLAGPGVPVTGPPGGAVEPTGFLYPFIEAEERDPGPLLADLATSARSKARESAACQQAALAEHAGLLAAAAARIAESFQGGGRLYCFGNGGSSTDCATFAALFAQPPAGRALPVLDLAADQAILTALGNDVGFELVFSRQLVAYASRGDAAAAFSTSGSSADLLVALGEAKSRGLLTVAFTGGTGGQLACSPAVDFCFVVRSQSIHRVQESQALLGYQLWASVRRLLGQDPSGATPGGTT